MNAFTHITRSIEFATLWSVRQLLRGIALGFGLTAGLVSLSLLAVVGALGSLNDILDEHLSLTAVSLNSTHQTTHSRRHKEILS